MNPLSDVRSEFYLPPEERIKFIRVSQNKEKRCNPLFKKARFIYVHKINESPNRYKLLGTYRRTRNYGIAILTDDNNYYYNELQTKQTVLSYEIAVALFRIFCDGYVLDGDTRIVIDSSLNVKNEPLGIFLVILARSIGVDVRKRAIEDIFLSLTNSIRCLLPRRRPNQKGKPVCRRVGPTIMRHLLEDGWLDFLPEDLRTEMTKEKTDPSWRRKLIFYCAAGILYMFRTTKNKRTQV